MNFFWVNIGATYKEVINGQFLWAPLKSVNKRGTEIEIPHWDTVAEVKAGDVIFCCYDQRIKLIATAVSDAFLAPRPPRRSFQAWNTEGRRVDVSLKPLHRAIHRAEFASVFIDQFDRRVRPSLFNKERTINQTYMSYLPPDAGVFLLEATGTIADYENRLIDEASPGTRKIAQTTREAIIQARIGQGKFRADLIRAWRGRCALTAVSNPDLLVASHIEAWSLCENDARIDPHNGLLLVTHMDRLFDRGLISFADTGALLTSGRLRTDERRVFGLDQFSTILGLSENNKFYLARHRSRHGF